MLMGFLTFLDTPTTQGLSLWCFNIVDGVSASPKSTSILNFASVSRGSSCIVLFRGFRRTCRICVG